MKFKLLCKKISINIKELFFLFKLEDGLDEIFESWLVKKVGIFIKYIIFEKLFIIISFLFFVDKEKSKFIVIK